MILIALKCSVLFLDNTFDIVFAQSKVWYHWLRGSRATIKMCQVAGHVTFVYIPSAISEQNPKDILLKKLLFSLIRGFQTFNPYFIFLSNLLAVLWVCGICHYVCKTRGGPITIGYSWRPHINLVVGNIFKLPVMACRWLWRLVFCFRLEKKINMTPNFYRL